jgi:hypothetical protein
MTQESQQFDPAFDPKQADWQNRVPQEPVDSGRPAPEDQGQDWPDVSLQQPQKTPAKGRRGQPALNDVPARSASRASKFILVLLVLGLLGVAGWYFINHHGVKSRRLPGMGMFDVPTKTTARAATAKKVPRPAAATLTAASSAPVGLKVSGAFQPAAPSDSVSPTDLTRLAVASMPGPAIAPQGSVLGAVPSSTSAADFGLPAASQTEPEKSSSAVMALPAVYEARSVNTNDYQDLKQRVQKLEDALLVMQTRQDQYDAKHGATDAAPKPSPLAERARPAHYRSRAAAAEPKAVASAAEAAAPQPALGTQLLSVDMWGGTPSVVVTSGLNGDTRTRTLRPGDTMNGVTLRAADPATGRATFVSGGHVFTLSLRDGG